MKHLYALSLLFLVNFVSQAQIIDIPDTYFKAQLLSGSATRDQAGVQIDIDVDNDDEISEDEALLAYALEFTPSAYNITDLTGLNYFTNLTILKGDGQNFSSVNLMALTNLVEVDLQYNSINSINLSGLTQLETLKLNNNNLYTLNVSTLTGLKVLEFRDNDVTNLTLPTVSALERLDCYMNNLPNLNVSNHQNLRYLRCMHNEISTLNIVGLTLLEELYCGWNNISAINLSSLTSLNSFGCENNNITTLDFSMFTDFEWINCENNQITSLQLPGNLITLMCSGNLLSSLNVAPLTNLEALWCMQNMIPSLNVAGLTNLRSLECALNPLTTLDIAPLTNLQYLRFGNPTLAPVDISTLTQLIQLQFYGGLQTEIQLNFPDLEVFSAIESNFSELDLSNCPKVKTIYFSKNDLLTNINIKHGGGVITNAYFHMSPLLQYICANEADIVFIKNKVDYYLPENNVEVNSYCAFNPGGNFNTIAGTARFDYDMNGCGMGDIVCDFLKVIITDGTNTGTTFTNGGGGYQYSVQQPNITIVPSLENPSYFAITPATASFNFPANNGALQVQDFCLAANGSHPDLEIILLPLTEVRPGNYIRYRIICRNKGNQVISGSINFNFNDLYADFNLAYPVQSTATSNSIVWNFTDLLPFETNVYIATLMVHTPSDAQPVVGGESFVTNASVVYSGTDDTPLDNQFTLTQTVVNSFDPNDKTCLEGNVVSPDVVGDFVHYMIRFENTGTATAQNIVVKDIIDSTKFEIATLMPLDGSHPFETKITSGNKVEFIFENIELPFDDLNNDGFVAFKIKTKSNLAIGSTFSNTASIYFDYNNPIITNTETTTIQMLGRPDIEFDQYFTLAPNPAKDIINLNTASGTNVSSVTIFNMLGQSVIIKTSGGTIDVSWLTSGTYFLRVETNRGRALTRFIKE